MIKLYDRRGAGGTMIVDAVDLTNDEHRHGDRAFGMRVILGRPGRSAQDFTATPVWYDYAPRSPRGPWTPDLEDATDAASGSLMSTGKVIWRGAGRGPDWARTQTRLFDAAKLHAQMAETEARANPARGRKLWMLQTVRVPRTHPDVVAHGTEGAVAVAKRRKVVWAKPTKGDRTDKNYISFEQFAPGLATREYRSLKTPPNAPKDRAVLMVSAVVKPAVTNAKLRRVTIFKDGGRGKSVTAVYEGPRFWVVVHVTPKQAQTLPKTATLAELAAKYAPGHKPQASLANVRLATTLGGGAEKGRAKTKPTRVKKTAKDAKKPAARRNPRGKKSKRPLAFWI